VGGADVMGECGTNGWKWGLSPNWAALLITRDYSDVFGS
jgi:hypothetical protein